MAVRSKTLGVGDMALPGVGALAYQVPVGFRTIWKGAGMMNTSGITGIVVAAIVRPPLQLNALWRTIPAGEGITEIVWHVLEEGDQLWVFAGATVTGRIWFSGAELPL